jgi:tRNA/tmRNA/rRNA uracil-C5-methylase (TrmA/RlmC/RlmD family)
VCCPYDDRVASESTPQPEILSIVLKGRRCATTYAATVAKTESDVLLELDVGAIAGGGGCVARAPDGRIVFVRHAIPGERVRARVTATNSSYLRADAVQILLPSSDRVEPLCPHAGPGRCGGCDFQHVSLPAQRRLKAFRIAEQLHHLAGVERPIEVEPVDGDSGGLAWRTRVRVAVGRDGRTGFHRHRSHRLEHVDTCPVASPAVLATNALTATWPGATELEIVTGGEGEALVAVTARGRHVPRRLEATAGLVMGGTVQRPPGAVHTQVQGRTFRISAGVFWQVHAGAPTVLLSAVLGLVGDCRGAAVVDLYAGAGLFAVPLAESVGTEGSVIAVERDPRACADLRHNGTGLDALRVLHDEVTPELVAEGIGHPRVVVLDPAREGAGTRVMGALAAQAASMERLVYVSCDPASFGRDARVLLDAGWELSSLRAFDIFPMTEHVELVAAFAPAARSN